MKNDVLTLIKTTYRIHKYFLNVSNLFWGIKTWDIPKNFHLFLRPVQNTLDTCDNAYTSVYNAIFHFGENDEIYCMPLT